jgi:hypothetical protein
MILSLVTSFDRCRVAGTLFLFSLVVAANGCGSSPPTGTVFAQGGAKGAAELLKPEQRWKFEGVGRDKRKVQISRRERVRLLHEAQKNAN